MIEISAEPIDTLGKVTPTKTNTPIPTITLSPTSIPTATPILSGYEPLENYSDYALAIQVNNVIYYYSLETKTLITTINKPNQEYLYGRNMVFFSSDGKYLAYEDEQKSKIGIYLFDIQTATETLLYQNPSQWGDSWWDTWGYWISWSPDNQKVAFQEFDDRNSEIYIYDIETSSLTNITLHQAFDYAPDWSPDGETIIFLSDRDRGCPQIFSMSPDGTNVNQLTRLSTCDFLNPTWSPDGFKIAYRLVTNPITSRNWDELQRSSIYLMNPDGSDIVELVNGDDYLCYQCDEIVWSSDNKFITFKATYQDETGVFIVNLETKEITKISEGLQTPLIWSPTNESIFLYDWTDFDKDSVFEVNIHPQEEPELISTYEGEHTLIYTIDIVDFSIKQ